MPARIRPSRMSRRRPRRLAIPSRRFSPSRPGTRLSVANPSCRRSSAMWRRRRSSSSRMKADFEQWLTAQFADTGPFTVLIVLVRIAGEEVVALKSSYAHLIGDDMAWSEMRALLDRARAPWDGAAFFVGLGHAGGPLPHEVAPRKLPAAQAH